MTALALGTPRPTTETAGPRPSVAVVAPPWFEVPPAAYGGIESMCDLLVRGLHRRGNDVTLLSAGLGRSSVPSVAVWDSPAEGLGHPEAPVIELAYIADACKILAELSADIVHLHGLTGLVTAHDRSWRTVSTQHGPMYPWVERLLAGLEGVVAPVAISASQRASAPGVPWAATVHNGIDVASFPVRERKDNYVAFLGRMHPHKGPDLAIDAARAAGVPLVMAAKCTDPAEREYFDQAIAPRLGRGAEYVGEVTGADKAELLGGARALVFPITWDEPFGLVMAEALACGTPVVALRRGSVPEVIRDGVTGFTVPDASDLPAAIEASAGLDPRDCRADAAARFDAEVMVRGYEEVYASSWRREGMMSSVSTS